MRSYHALIHSFGKEIQTISFVNLSCGRCSLHGSLLSPCMPATVWRFPFESRQARHTPTHTNPLSRPSFNSPAPFLYIPRSFLPLFSSIFKTLSIRTTLRPRDLFDPSNPL
jgi:hypothetical protein